MDVFNIVPTEWISHIEGSYNNIELGPLFVDYVINRGPYRDCNAA